MRDIISDKTIKRANRKTETETRDYSGKSSEDSFHGRRRKKWVISWYGRNGIT